MGREDKRSTGGGRSLGRHAGKCRTMEGVRKFSRNQIPEEDSAIFGSARHVGIAAWRNRPRTVKGIAERCPFSRHNNTPPTRCKLLRLLGDVLDCLHSRVIDDSTL